MIDINFNRIELTPLSCIIPYKVNLKADLEVSKNMDRLMGESLKLGVAAKITYETAREKILSHYTDVKLKEIIDAMNTLQYFFTVGGKNWFERTKPLISGECGYLDFEHSWITENLDTLKKLLKESQDHMNSDKVKSALDELLIMFPTSKMVSDIHQSIATFDGRIKTFIDDCNYLLSSFEEERKNNVLVEIELDLCGSAFRSIASAGFLLVFKYLVVKPYFEGYNDFTNLVLLLVAVPGIAWIALERYNSSFMKKRKAVVQRFHYSLSQSIANKKKLRDTSCSPEKGPNSTHEIIEKNPNLSTEIEQGLEKKFKRFIDDTGRIHKEEVMKEINRLISDCARLANFQVKFYEESEKEVLSISLRKKTNLNALKHISPDQSVAGDIDSIVCDLGILLKTIDKISDKDNGRFKAMMPSVVPFLTEHEKEFQRLKDTFPQFCKSIRGLAELQLKKVSHYQAALQLFAFSRFYVISAWGFHTWWKINHSQALHWFWILPVVATGSVLSALYHSYQFISCCASNEDAKFVSSYVLTKQAKSKRI